MNAFVNSTATYTVPNTSVNIRRITLTADATITLAAFTTTGKVWTLTIFVKQDATGSRTLTWAAPGGDSIKWDGGSAPPYSSGANKTTIYQFIKSADDTVWYGSMTWRED